MLLNSLPGAHIPVFSWWYLRQTVSSYVERRDVLCEHALRKRRKSDPDRLYIFTARFVRDRAGHMMSSVRVCDDRRPRVSNKAKFEFGVISCLHTTGRCPRGQRLIRRCRVSLPKKELTCYCANTRSDSGVMALCRYMHESCFIALPSPQARQERKSAQ